MTHEYTDTARDGDHICYISDLTKIRQHYPKWSLTRDLRATMEEICCGWRDRTSA
jgi:CDP-paratose 2-epimerase